MSRTSGTSDLVDLTLKWAGDSANAVCVIGEIGQQHGKRIWLPKSQIEYERKPGGMVELQVPEWLADQKGLI